MTSAPDYDIRLAARALRRYWWVVLAVPAVALVVQLYGIGTAPYRAEFRAVVVLPGDTEIPGSSERPELMILDDVPQLVASHLFADRVAAQLVANGPQVDSDDIRSSLSATRYARTVTVVVRNDGRAETEAIAMSAQESFPVAVDEALVIAGGPQATITMLDPVDGARRGDPDQRRVAMIVTVAMVFVGILGALAVDGLRRPEVVG